jgi:hypothetical protein
MITTSNSKAYIYDWPWLFESVKLSTLTDSVSKLNSNS